MSLLIQLPVTMLEQEMVMFSILVLLGTLVTILQLVMILVIQKLMKLLVTLVIIQIAHFRLEEDFSLLILQAFRLVQLYQQQP